MLMLTMSLNNFRHGEVATKWHFVAVAKASAGPTRSVADGLPQDSPLWLLGPSVGDSVQS